jgi:hypothetical protein
VPSSPSISAMLKVTEQLVLEENRSTAELSELCGFSVKTIGNVIHDLSMFGIATVEQSEARLASPMKVSDQEKILQRLRHVLQSHALTMRLSKRDQGEIITMLDIIQLLKQINPAAQHKERTWRTYAEKMGHWLSVTGYLIQRENDWKLEDQGKVNLESIDKTRKARRGGRITVFIGDTSPIKTLEAFDYLRSNQPLSAKEIQEKGFRNAVTALRGLGVVKNELGSYSIIELTEFESRSSLEILWSAACNEQRIQLVIDYLKEHPIADGKSIGNYISQEFKCNWSVSSEMRVGNSLRQWASWVLIGMSQKRIPEPLGRVKAESKDQLPLFQDE